MLVGSVPASAEPSCIESTGIASTSSRPAEATAAGHGWRWMNRLQANQNPVPSGRARPSPGTRQRSTPRPTRLSIAGSSVREASIVSSTATDEASAGAYRNCTPSANMPSSAITTVAPANSTARPAVSMASSTASSTPSPIRNPARNRVTTKSA